MQELIIRYTGNLEALQSRIGFAFEALLGGYAIVRILEEDAPKLLAAPEILWTEVPARVYTTVTNGRVVSCISSVQARYPGLTGAGVLVAIVDSGIDWRHPDFKKEDGTTRIATYWDQTAEDGQPPEGYLDGVLYSAEEINRFLIGEGSVTGGAAPGEDLSGHGTHVAGIAAGNGAASGGRYRGVACESELLVVKLGGTQTDPFPQTTNLMTAVDFCIRYAARAGKPLCINLSFGNSEGSHDGRSLLETYLDEASLYGKVCICIGTGNEGATGIHAGGRLREGEMPEEILLSVGVGEKRVSFGLWLNSLDTVEVVLVSPSGREERIPQNLQGEKVAVKGYPAAGGTMLSFGETSAQVFVGEATPYRGLREIAVTLRGEGEIAPGTWRVRLQPKRILQGEYDLWLTGGRQNTGTSFLRPVPERTLTIPSTAERPIAVAAYDGRTNGLAAFSGKGYPRDAGGTKPDLAAPGVDIVSCAPGGGYTTKSGTSMATPFVTGAAALLMQWGIVQGNDPYLYGERLKSILLKTARQLPGITEYPNPYIGWGTLCLSLEEE